MGTYSSPTLPVELWREVLLHVCSLPDEFDISSTAYGETTHDRHKIYLHIWPKAMKQRLKVALISKSFHTVATEFLYSSFIIRCDSDYARVVEIVRCPETARHLRRVTINRKISWLNFEEFCLCNKLCMYVDFTEFEFRNDPEEWTSPPIMGPNLTYLEVSNIQTDSLDWENMLEILPEYRSLRALRLTGVIEGDIDSALSDRQCILPQLELLELTKDFDEARTLLFTQWLPSLVLPKLNTLLLLNAGDLPGPALSAFGRTIYTLRINKCPLPMTPGEKILLPKLRRLIVPYDFGDGVRWERLPAVIQTEAIEVFEVYLALFIRQFNGSFREPWGPLLLTDLHTVLGLPSDPSITPNLKEVDLDLSLETYGAAGVGFQKGLTQWSKEMRGQRPEVKLRTHFWEEDTEWTSISLDCLITSQTGKRNRVAKVK